jgi:succinyl-CoA synthetase beta subunit
MNTHEHQAKAVLKSFAVPVPPYAVIDSLDELPGALAQLEIAEEAVLKVQVHAGGRGKAGGVRLARSRAKIEADAKEMLGMKIVNNQTGPEGVYAHSLLITPLLQYGKEYYLAAVIDRPHGRAMLIASPAGGVDIEEVAAATPEKIATFPIQLSGEVRGYHLLQLAKFMGWSGAVAERGKAVAQGIARAFMASDASLLEINPLVETFDGHIVALDAKLSIDENALFRHPEFKNFFDASQLPATEVLAHAADLAYVALDGEIGCMVNGAGLAMATMDIIENYGGRPANFLDVGGGASEEKVAEGFKIILGDPHVKAILVNIFGGIMNCETLASGIIMAAAKEDIDVPLVVRMEGTNVDKGKKKLFDSGLNIIVADGMADAAEKIVQAAANSKRGV